MFNLQKLAHTGRRNRGRKISNLILSLNLRLLRPYYDYGNLRNRNKSLISGLPEQSTTGTRLSACVFFFLVRRDIAQRMTVLPLVCDVSHRRRRSILPEAVSRTERFPGL